MSRSTSPVQILPPFTRNARERLEANRKAGMGLDAAARKANRRAVAELIKWLEGQCEGERAVTRFWKQLRCWGCRLDQDGEWTRRGVRLDSPEGREWFVRESRFQDAFLRLVWLKAILTGSVFLNGTLDELKHVALVAFEAGARYAESQAQKKRGRPRKRTAEKRKTLRLLRETEKRIMVRDRKSREQVAAKDIWRELRPEPRPAKGEPYSSRMQANLVSEMRREHPT